MTADYELTEFELLADSQRAGKWGFSLDLNQFGPSATNPNVSGSLLTTDMPAHAARVWTLNLNAHKYASGALTAGIPPDNQTRARVTCRLDYGVDSSMESVRFDYPPRGCTVQFHAASFRVYLESLQLLPAPLVGGFVTPYSRGNVAADVLPSCTLTQQGFLTVGIGTNTAYAPPRARGYRLIPASTGTLGVAVNTQQLDGNGVSISVDLSTTFPAPVTDVRSAFIPLQQDAMAVQINASATSFYSVQWLLDIG